jgi:hypothetical protein
MRELPSKNKKRRERPAEVTPTLEDSRSMS